MKDQSSNRPSSKTTCRVVRLGHSFSGKQELLYESGISAATVGSVGIRMQIATIAPSGKAKAHKHDAHETAISRDMQDEAERLERIALYATAGYFNASSALDMMQMPLDIRLD